MQKCRLIFNDYLRRRRR